MGCDIVRRRNTHNKKHQQVRIKDDVSAPQLRISRSLTETTRFSLSEMVTTL